ncbi:Dirigent protein [Melia azedarach]|uniref:Dirigent protein n=1 Tax=Melia azedarach TaxID=155640 RepID=A0ACC1YM53_MELAZ|nr:Dirigent protein [Melia azedarach]
MAGVFPSLMSISQIFIFFFFFLSFSAECYGYATTLDRKHFGLKKEKLSHFKLFWHDIYSGSNPTAVGVVRPQKNSSTMFGSISVIDDPLTEGPELSSKLVGKAQGLYSSAGQEEVGLLMVMNFVFLEGKYNGSTITILGRNKVFSPMREMPVIGGSGLFRYARGYVEARTHLFNPVTGDATIEYNIYVLHY